MMMIMVSMNVMCRIKKLIHGDILNRQRNVSYLFQTIQNLWEW